MPSSPFEKVTLAAERIVEAPQRWPPKNLTFDNVQESGPESTLYSNAGSVAGSRPSFRMVYWTRSSKTVWGVVWGASASSLQWTETTGASLIYRFQIHSKLYLKTKKEVQRSINKSHRKAIALEMCQYNEVLLLRNVMNVVKYLCTTYVQNSWTRACVQWYLFNFIHLRNQ